MKERDMRKSKKRDPIPEHFKSVEEAAEFWDTHDLSDYWDLTKEVEFEANIQRRVFLTALEPELAKKIADCAHKQGVSTETLINVWLSEKLAEVTTSA
ncbi:MAG TPA: CopG family antitoxin [Blastocatellia bacterium]|nr:CopG family antitoxin [Blastocatellia bacterium]